MRRHRSPTRLNSARELVTDTVRPIISHQVAAACQQAAVKGLTIMSNSIYNGWRFEDVWLDR